MAKEAEVILEEAAQVVGDTIDLVEDNFSDVITVTRNNPWLIMGALVVGLGVGGFAAWKIASKRTEARCEEQMVEEIEQAKDFYKRLHKQEEFETPEKAAEALLTDAAEALTDYSGKGPIPYNRPEQIVVTPPTDDPRPPIRNVFADVRDPRDWDYAAEVEWREKNPGVPYVVSREEFEENPDHHEQITLTWYSKDQILANAADETVEDTNYTVGDDNLTRFGAGSEDNKIVYIRNDRISADFEILYSDGAYEDEVLGGGAELRHSDLRHVNRMRSSGSPRRMRERDDG